MSTRPELRLKSVLQKLLIIDKFIKTSKLYLSSFLLWFIVVLLIQTYLREQIHIIWSLAGFGVIHSFNKKFIRLYFTTQPDVLDAIEKHLLQTKVLSDLDRGILTVLGDNLQKAQFKYLLPFRQRALSNRNQVQRKYSPSLIELMYQRLEPYCESINRQRPEFPKELMVACLVCVYFWGPQVLQGIDISNPFDSKNTVLHTQMGPQQSKIVVSDKLIKRSEHQVDSKLQEPKQPWPKKLSINLNQNLERQLSVKKGARQSGANSRIRSAKVQNKQEDQTINIDTEKKHQTKVMIGQVGGKVSGKTTANHSGYGEQQRLIELSTVSKLVQNNQSLDSTDGYNRPSKTVKELQGQTLSQSRRQELINEAYLLGAHTQVQAQDLPLALRSLIKSN